jgi:hypothetical protein
LLAPTESQFNTKRFAKRSSSRNPAVRLFRVLAAGVLPAALALAGCGGSTTTGSSNGDFNITPGSLAMDTNCTGCNDSSSGFEQFSASTSGGAAVNVNWTLSGGDQYAGKGSISSTGQYTPPSYLTADSVTVTVTATSTANSSQTATATVTITPGFLQPLTPENVALSSGATATITGLIAEVGGSTSINFSAANSANGSGGGQGSMGSPSCTRGNVSNGDFTSCAATYTAPSVSSTETTFVVGTIGTSSSKASTVVLLNTAGVTSNPTTHQATLPTPIYLGSSGGNNKDFDTVSQNGQTLISDCCGGTLGSMVQDASANQYILSNNHVLARSDQAAAGETIIQPGLIDNASGACQPEGQGGNETPVGVLKGFVPVNSTTSDVDAAIASVNSGAVNTGGAILELGAQSGATLSPAPPGTSSTAGKGEAPSLNMVVAKSGRTTGLTCASISATNLQVQVSYFTNCAETNPYYTKTYTNQIGITGNQFSDAGDSGSLVVDTTTGEPVGLFFAGGENSSGQSEGVASPATEVLNELGSFVGGTYTFVGTTDHAVSCLNYGAGTATIAQSRTLSAAEMDRAQQAMTDARSLINPIAGVFGRCYRLRRPEQERQRSAEHRRCAY